MKEGRCVCVCVWGGGCCGKWGGSGMCVVFSYVLG